MGGPYAVDPILVCDLLELGCRRARTGQLGGRERDLDLGGEEARAGKWVQPFVLERAPDRGGRRVDLSLREAQEREAGLSACGVAELVRLLVGLLRLCEVAASAPDSPISLKPAEVMRLKYAPSSSHA